MQVKEMSKQMIVMCLLTIFEIVEKYPDSSDAQFVLRINADYRYKGGQKRINQIVWGICRKLVTLLWKLKE